MVRVVRNSFVFHLTHTSSFLISIFFFFKRVQLSREKDKVTVFAAAYKHSYKLSSMAEGRAQCQVRDLKVSYAK